MATQTRSPGSIIEGNIFGYGSIHWVNIGNMASSNNVYATATRVPPLGYYPYTPVCTDFGFTIPAGSVITKIDVLIEAKSTDLVSHLDWVTLMIAGNPSLFRAYGNQAADYAPDQPLTGTDVVYTINSVSSGDGNLWGNPWTLSMINDITFGCAFDCDIEVNQAIAIDHVQITVTYEEGEPLDICENRPCNMGFEDLDMAIKAVIGQIDFGPFVGCAGLKIAPRVKPCAELTDLKDCGTTYTLEEAFKAALQDDGCGGASLRMFVLFPDGGPQ